MDEKTQKRIMKAGIILPLFYVPVGGVILLIPLMIEKLQEPMAYIINLLVVLLACTWFFLVVFSLIASIVAAVMHISGRKDFSSDKRLKYLIVLLLLPWLGVTIYYYREVYRKKD